MADQKSKKRADGKRVATSQRYEREYIIEQLEITMVTLSNEFNRISHVVERLRTGFPAKKRGKP